MSSLILDSLEICNFRLLHHVRFERLGRVNLIVGKNGTGKSSVLEAIQLYIRQGSVIRELLESRDEVRDWPPEDDPKSFPLLSAVKHLFHNHPEINGSFPSIQIGPIDSPAERVSISVGLYSERVDSEGRLLLLPVKDEEMLSVGLPGLAVQTGTQPEIVYPLDSTFPRPYLKRGFSRFIPLVFLPANGLSEQIGAFWDAGIQKGYKDDILSILKIISTEIEDVLLIGDRSRYPLVRLKGQKEFIALRSLGEGTNRLFGTAVALVNAQNGLLLVDEIESGLHYSVFSKMWEIIIEAASRLNIQVFATTHSLDCVKGFQEAATENQQEEGVLLRLENRGGQIVPILFDEKLLTVAAVNDLEVR